MVHQCDLVELPAWPTLVVRTGTLLARHGVALDGTRVESPTREAVFCVSGQSSNGWSIGAAS